VGQLSGHGGFTSSSAARDLGITPDGVRAAMQIKESYKTGEPVCVPGRAESILMPETLLNTHLDLKGIGDPLALAMMATRDPEAPMAMAATARLSPAGGRKKLIGR